MDHIDKELETEFASAECSTPRELELQTALICQRDLLVDALNAIPEIVLILNRNHQIVHCNNKLLSFLNIDVEQVLGKRPGEVLNCIHSVENTAGCGTAKFCRECGAVKSILIAQGGVANREECRITAVKGAVETHYDLRIWSEPIQIESQPFTLFAVQDIAHEKRREVLERTFFHDVINEAVILQTYIDNILDGIIPPTSQVLLNIRAINKRILDHIASQNILLSAEEGKLKTRQNKIGVRNFLENIVTSYSSSEYAKGKKLVLRPVDMEEVIVTDETLFDRVLVNLIKNALEASVPGETITVRYRREKSKKIFSVHNPTAIPEHVQLQIFQRSFSTKGKGRGIGTYSAKFLAETYLKGQVYFISAKDTGTTFFVELDGIGEN